MVALFTKVQSELSLVVMIGAGGTPAVVVAGRNHQKLPGINDSTPPSSIVISRVWERRQL